jgi:hypothetical protein
VSVGEAVSKMTLKVPKTWANEGSKNKHLNQYANSIKTSLTPAIYQLYLKHYRFIKHWHISKSKLCCIFAKKDEQNVSKMNNLRACDTS